MEAAVTDAQAEPTPARLEGGVQVVEIAVDTTGFTPQAVALRAGFTREGTVRSCLDQRDGSWTDTLRLRGTRFDYIIRPGGAEVYGFEIADPGQPAPTIPDIVLTPIEDAPEPR